MLLLVLKFVCLVLRFLFFLSFLPPHPPYLLNLLLTIRILNTWV